MPDKHEDQGTTLKMLLSEAIGTALLVFMGIGSVVTATGGAKYVHNQGKEDEISYMVLGYNSQGQPVSTSTCHVALAFGLTVTAIAYAIGGISGAHLNPAVSFGLAAAGRTTVSNAFKYSGAQTVGAVIGALMLKQATSRVIMMKNDVYNPGMTYNPEADFMGWHLGASLLGPGMGLFSGIIFEAILTFFLVFVVCGTTDDRANGGLAPLAIGFAVFTCHATGIALTGSSVNPARSIGPAILTPVNGALTDLTIYIIGPLMGGIVAGYTYKTNFSSA